jgi:hypothetical protein
MDPRLVESALSPVSCQSLTRFLGGEEKDYEIPGAGAFFPAGYSPRFDDDYPWICPLRDCQTVFKEAWNLGGHFSVLKTQFKDFMSFPSSKSY